MIIIIISMWRQGAGPVARPANKRRHRPKGSATHNEPRHARPAKKRAARPGQYNDGNIIIIIHSI